MRKFKYVAQKADGTPEQGVLTAENRDLAVGQLQRRGYLVLSIKEQEGVGIYYTGRIFQWSGVSETEKMFFAGRIAALLKGGIPILRSLQLLAKSGVKGRLNEVIKGIAQDVARGNSLHKAVAKHPAVFSPLWTSLLEVGETTGSLPNSFVQIARYIYMSEELKGKVITALAYPAVLFMSSMGILFFFIFRVVPTFAEIFSTFQIKLPPLTQFLISFGHSVTEYAWLWLVTLICLIVCCSLIFNTPAGRLGWVHLRGEMPFFGPYLEILEMEKLLSTFATLLSSGINILRAMEILENVLRENPVLAGHLARIRGSITRGKSIAESFEATQGFPPLVVEMLRIGEEAGNINEMAQSLAQYYRELAQQMTQRFTAIIDPILVIFVGSLVTVVVMGLFMPIFKISQLGSR